jgi:hypothetical protein
VNPNTVTLQCCAQARAFSFLQMPDEFYYETRKTKKAFFEAVRATPPVWALRATQDHFNGYDKDPDPRQYPNPIVCCPFCAEFVPSLRLCAKPPKKVCVIIDGGYYCDTCEERLNACECKPAVFLWEVVS